MSSLISLFMEQPWAPKKGLHGYGFDYQSTSAFTMSIWIGCICAQIWGQLLSDRVPLAIAPQRIALLAVIP